MRRIFKGNGAGHRYQALCIHGTLHALDEMGGWVFFDFSLGLCVGLEHRISCGVSLVVFGAVRFNAVHCTIAGVGLEMAVL